MVDIIKAIVLGVVQGATEFIPVSSSGHLVIIPWLLGWEPPSLLFNTILHWGTLCAIFLVFWRDFWAMIVAGLGSLRTRSLEDSNARLAWFIVLASIPTAVLGLILKDFFESVFADGDSPALASVFLFITAALLIGSEVMARRLQRVRTLAQIRVPDAIVIGLAQAAALAPGISRSGSTIAAGLACGLQREEAARFSFLLGAPAFLGAGLLELTSALAEDSELLVTQAPTLVAGFLVSAITGFIAIRYLLAYLRDHSLYIFAIYCILAGAAVLTLSYLA